MKTNASTWALLAILGMTLPGCGTTASSHQPPSPPSKPLLVSGDGFEGAIFSTIPVEGMFAPDTSEGHWTPSLADVTAFEQGLRSFLEQELARWTERDNAHAVRSIRGILDNLRMFRRQYFGVVRDGSRLIYVNCFPNPATEGEGYDEEFDWLEEFVGVCDGGFWFWRVEYDPERRQYHRLDWNGEA